jgi:tryptophan 2,3-dioxygenase
MKAVYYSEYLQLDKILNAQELESDKHQKHAHDEMLFVVIHQAYELWFKQLLFEADSVIGIFSQDSINDNSPDLQIAVHRLKRMGTILKVLVQQIDIMETMTPMDFLDFRDMLRPASGFQSIQFKMLEALLGLKYEHRHGQQYYISQLNEPDVDKIKSLENRKTLLELVNKWLERMPYFKNENLWNDYRAIYASSLQEAELGNLEHFDKIFFNNTGNEEQRSLSADASRAALFIMLYRHYPLMHLPFELIESLLEIDELLSTWRFRHINMVSRIIGMRIGTGGSTGKGYLKGALDAHYIFKDFSSLTSFLIERNKLPKLNLDIVEKLGFDKD